MQTEIKIAWSTRRSEGFELREFAVSVLEIAKENLVNDGELLPTVFIITAATIECAPISFADEGEKTRMYGAVIDRAKSLDAVALITVNNGFMRNDFDAEEIDGYYPGKLEAEGAPRCIMVTVTGPGIKNWFLEQPYEQTANGFQFLEICEDSGGEVGFLDGWASDENAVN